MTDVALTNHTSRNTFAFGLLCGLAVVFLLLSGIGVAVIGGEGSERYTVPLFIVQGAIAIVACRVANDVPARRALMVIIGIGVLVRLICLAQEPLLSTDVYRYVWDGRVQAAGINPFRYVPADPALAALRDAAIYPHINRAEYAPTAYPPVAQMFFLAVTRISESTLAMRLMLVACEFAIVAIMWDLLRRFRLPVTLIAAYAWHPLSIWEVSGTGHVEALMVALLMLGVWLLARARPLAGGIAVTLAALVKPYAIIALPAFWRRLDWRLPLAASATIAICYLPYFSAGSSATGFVPQYLTEEGLRDGSAFWPVLVLQRFIGDWSGWLPIYLAVALGTLAWLARRAGCRRNPAPKQRIADIALLLMAGLFFISPNYPWYYLVLAPLIPFGGGAPAWVLTVTAPLLYLWWTPVDDPRLLLWKSAINIAFLATVLFGLFARRSATPGGAS